MPRTVHIRPVSYLDLPLLQQHFAESGIAKHAERLQRQAKGDVVYLIACCDELPVGHALLKWNGSQDVAVQHLLIACPDVEDLFVMVEFRSQGFGSGLLEFAERLTRERGYSRIGLSVGIDNGRAFKLYGRLGYREAGCGEYIERGEYVDGRGQLCAWEETCIYLIRDLGVTSVPE